MLFTLFQCTVGSKVANVHSSIKTNDVVGMYRYDPDSVQVPNRDYHESLLLSPDSTFIYKVRQGSFIDYSTTGSWDISEGYITLQTDATFPRATLERRECSTVTEIRVYGQSGESIHFVLFGSTLNGRDTTIHSTTIGKVELADLGLRNAVVLSTSGIASPAFDIKQNECSKIRIKLPKRRFFDNERWKWKDGKIIPLNSRGAEQSYYLYRAH